MEGKGCPIIMNVFLDITDKSANQRRKYLNKLPVSCRWAAQQRCYVRYLSFINLRQNRTKFNIAFHTLPISLSQQNAMAGK